MGPTYLDVLDAARVLEGIAHRTPVLTSRQADEFANARVFFKCENFQRVGSFKFRGAYNAIVRLDAEQKQRGILTFSSGNHAQAIAFAARMLGSSATILMPSDSPQLKIDATRSYGAEIFFYESAEECEAVMARLIEERGLTLIPPFDHRDIIAAQGTVAKELLEEVGPLDFLFACVGGGGLLAGSALVIAQMAPECALIGVEPEAGNDAQQSLQSGRIVGISKPHTIADGARAERIGELAFPLIRAHVREIVTVSDEEIWAQMRFFLERMKILVEPTGCLAAAAVLAKRIDTRGAKVGVILSGGNVAMATLAQSVQSI